MNYKLQFPLGIHLWYWWYLNGLRNSSDGVVGGSFLMRRLREFYSLIFRIRGDQSRIHFENSVLFVDVLDMRTYKMIIPQFQQNDSELVLSQVIVPPGGILVDVGANVGVFSLLAWNESVSEVHSFEPNPSMMKLLQKTRAASAFSSKWFLHECAAGSALEKLQLYIDSNFSGTASLNKNWQGSNAKPVDVSMVSIDSLRDSQQLPSIDVLKMDVEGWEHSVLEGASSTLQSDKPYIWFEHNVSALKRSGADATMVLDQLEKAGYTRFYDICQLPELAEYSRQEVNLLDEGRLNLLAVSAERQTDFECRVLPAFYKRKAGS